MNEEKLISNEEISEETIAEVSQVEIQTTFNEDSLEVLVEEGSVENVIL